MVEKEQKTILSLTSSSDTTAHEYQVKLDKGVIAKVKELVKSLLEKHKDK